MSEKFEQQNLSDALFERQNFSAKIWATNFLSGKIWMALSMRQKTEKPIIYFCNKNGGEVGGGGGVGGMIIDFTGLKSVFNFLVKTTVNSESNWNSGNNLK